MLSFDLKFVLSDTSSFARIYLGHSEFFSITLQQHLNTGSLSFSSVYVGLNIFVIFLLYFYLLNVHVAIVRNLEKNSITFGFCSHPFLLYIRSMIACLAINYYILDFTHSHNTI